MSQLTRIATRIAFSRVISDFKVTTSDNDYSIDVKWGGKLHTNSGEIINFECPSSLNYSYELDSYAEESPVNKTNMINDIMSHFDGEELEMEMFEKEGEGHEEDIKETVRTRMEEIRQIIESYFASWSDEDFPYHSP